jgi:hypothetical protein
MVLFQTKNMWKDNQSFSCVCSAKNGFISNNFSREYQNNSFEINQAIFKSTKKSLRN